MSRPGFRNGNPQLGRAAVLIAAHLLAVRAVPLVARQALEEVGVAAGEGAEGLVSGHPKDSWILVYNIAVSAFLTLLGGIFSGLSVGLMGVFLLNSGRVELTPLSSLKVLITSLFEFSQRRVQNLR
ncbi:hypothetical protein P7C70_g6009, partial [Phenoliferia sp. Uapishka_3]